MITLEYIRNFIIYRSFCELFLHLTEIKLIIKEDFNYFSPPLLHKEKAFFEDCNYLLSQDKKHLILALEYYLNFLEEISSLVPAAQGKNKCWNIEHYFLRCAFLLKHYSTSQNTLTERFNKIVSSLSSEKVFLKIFVSYLINNKKALAETIEEFYKKFISNSAQFLHNLHEVQAFFDEKHRVFAGCTELLFMDSKTFTKEADIQTKNLIELTNKFYKEIGIEVKNHLREEKYKQFQNKIIDLHKDHLESLNVPLTPERWISQIAQSVSRDQELADFVQKIQSDPEKNKEMWSHATNLITIYKFPNFNKNSCSFEALLSLTIINLSKTEGIIDMLIESGAIVSQEYLGTQEIRSPLLSISEKNIIQYRNFLIQHLIVNNNLKTHEIIIRIKNLLDFSQKTLSGIHKEIIFCLEHIFIPEQKDFIRRLFIDRLVVLIEPLIVNNRTLYPDKQRTKLQKPRLKKHLKKLLDEILGQTLGDFFIEHRNDIAHPNQPLCNLSHYFIFALVLKILKNIYAINPH